MGILDAIKDMAGQSVSPDQGATGTTASVAGGLMQALEEHPGGLAGVMSQFQQNGMGEHVQNWASGQQQTADPQQIEQGLGNSGLIDSVAQKAGVSPEIAKTALATILPVVVAHFTNNGQQPAPESGFGGMASQILSKLG
jgi:uncharacterized protein YidB (DUF937 family)